MASTSGMRTVHDVANVLFKLLGRSIEIGGLETNNMRQIASAKL